MIRVGHLKFRADFECGNLGSVVESKPNEFDISITPDTCNSRYRLWFYFRVESSVHCIALFHIVNFSKTKSLFRSGMTPLFRSPGEPW
jgi:cytosolic carboxypeptidase protein 6